MLEVHAPYWAFNYKRDVTSTKRLRTVVHEKGWTIKPDRRAMPQGKITPAIAYVITLGTPPVSGQTAVFTYPYFGG